MGPMVLAEIEVRSRGKDEETNRMIAVENAKANFGNAELTREIAEIGVVEYEEGIFKQDAAVASGEVKLAESDWQRAQDAIEFTKERLTQLKLASKGTAGDVATVYLYEDNVLNAEAREPKARLALEQAQNKLKMLQEYTKPRKMKELQAVVLKARADELAKKADLEVEKARLDRVAAANRGGQVQATAANPLSVLKRAIAVEEKVRSGLAELQKAGSFDANRGKGLEALVKELEGLVDETEVGLGMFRVDRLRDALGAAGGRPGSGGAQTAPSARGSDRRKGAAGVQREVPAELASFFSGIGNRLKGYRVRLAELGVPLLESTRVPENDGAREASLVSMVDAATANLQRSTLLRECAELELKAFLEVTLPEETAICKQGDVLAKADLARAEKKGNEAGERLEKFRRLSSGSASDLMFEYQFQAAGFIAELEQKRAKFAIEQAASNLKVLMEYTKEKRTKELMSAIEKARSEELAAKAVSQLEEGRLVELRGRSKSGARPESKKKAIDAINQALAIDVAIRAKLEELTQNGKIDVGLQKEIADSTNRLGIMIENAENERSLAGFDRLKAEIDRATEPRPLFRLPFRSRPKNED